MDEDLKYFERYLDVYNNTPLCCRNVPYDWVDTPQSLPIEVMPYDLMLEEFSRELANSVNSIIRYERSLRSWSAVLDSLAVTEKQHVIVTFVEPLATCALNFPYVKARFFFAAAHLMHQANRLKGREKWVDNLAWDREITSKQADELGKGWKKYGKLKLAVQKIDSSEYRCETFDFRNSYTHRFSPRIEIGLANFVQRSRSSNGGVCYAFGWVTPITVKRISDIIERQCKYSGCAYKRFQTFVEQQLKIIRAYVNE